jgi:hypothetical protein
MRNEIVIHNNEREKINTEINVYMQQEEKVENVGDG